MKWISAIIILLFLNSCKIDYSTSNQTWFGEDLIVDTERNNFELKVNNLHKLDFTPPKLRKDQNWKTRTKVLITSNEIIQKDSFNHDGILIASIDNTCNGAESISLNKYGLIDAVFSIVKFNDPNKKVISIPIRVMDYYTNNGIVYRVVFLMDNGIKQDNYFYFEQFKYQDLILSKTYHWSHGGSGEQYRYYYSTNGNPKLDSIRSYRGPLRYKTMLVEKKKINNRIIETIIEKGGDTASVKIYNDNNNIIEERDYWKPNVYQETAYQKVYKYKYTFY